MIAYNLIIWSNLMSLRKENNIFVTRLDIGTVKIVCVPQYLSKQWLVDGNR